jgi:hypothetical protein
MKAMATNQKRISLTFSLPLNIAREFGKVAKAEAKNKNQLFCDMFQTYQQRLREKDFFELQRDMARQARKKGILTEADVDAIVFRDR